MTKIQFWPADYFTAPIASLVLSEPVAGQVRVAWQACRGHDYVDLYVRQHATNWPTLDGTSGGTVDPAFKVGSFRTPSAAISSYPFTIAPDSTSSVWTNTGYTNGQIVRAIAIPRGRFGWTGVRIFNNLTMLNAIGPALFISGSTYLDDGLQDGLSGGGLVDTPLWYECGLSQSSAVSNSGHDVKVEVMGFDGSWVSGPRKRYGIIGNPYGYSGYDEYADITEAGTLVRASVEGLPWVNAYPFDVARVMQVGVAFKLIPSGGGTPLDMIVHHFMWSLKTL